MTVREAEGGGGGGEGGGSDLSNPDTSDASSSSPPSSSSPALSPSSSPTPMTAATAKTALASESDAVSSLPAATGVVVVDKNKNAPDSEGLVVDGAAEKVKLEHARSVAAMEEEHQRKVASAKFEMMARLLVLSSPPPPPPPANDNNDDGTPGGGDTGSTTNSTSLPCDTSPVASPVASTAVGSLEAPSSLSPPSPELLAPSSLPSKKATQDNGAEADKLVNGDDDGGDSGVKDVGANEGKGKVEDGAVAESAVDVPNHRQHQRRNNGGIVISGFSPDGSGGTDSIALVEDVKPSPSPPYKLLQVTVVVAGVSGGGGRAVHTEENVRSDEPLEDLIRRLPLRTLLAGLTPPPSASKLVRSSGVEGEGADECLRALAGVRRAFPQSAAKLGFSPVLKDQTLDFSWAASNSDSRANSPPFASAASSSSPSTSTNSMAAKTRVSVGEYAVGAAMPYEEEPNGPNRRGSANNVITDSAASSSVVVAAPGGGGSNSNSSHQSSSSSNGGGSHECVWFSYGGASALASSLASASLAAPSAPPSCWEVYEGHDAFAGDNALTKPFACAEEAMKQCGKHGLGGFVVHQGTAYFRRQPRSELREKRIRSKGSVLYVAPSLGRKKGSSPRATSPRAVSPRAGSPRLANGRRQSLPTYTGSSSASSSSSARVRAGGGGGGGCFFNGGDRHDPSSDPSVTAKAMSHTKRRSSEGGDGGCVSSHSETNSPQQGLVPLASTWQPSRLALVLVPVTELNLLRRSSGKGNRASGTHGAATAVVPATAGGSNNKNNGARIDGNHGSSSSSDGDKGGGEATSVAVSATIGRKSTFRVPFSVTLCSSSTSSSGGASGSTSSTGGGKVAAAVAAAEERKLRVQRAARLEPVGSLMGFRESPFKKAPPNKNQNQKAQPPHDMLSTTTTTQTSTSGGAPSLAAMMKKKKSQATAAAPAAATGAVETVELNAASLSHLGACGGGPGGGSRGPVRRRVLTWRWCCVGGGNGNGGGGLSAVSPYSVGFSALFHPMPSTSAKAPLPQSLVSPFHTANHGCGEWVVCGEGTVVFEFDNTTSLFSGRDVTYSVAVHDLEH